MSIMRTIKQSIKNFLVQIPFLEKRRQIKAGGMVNTKKLDKFIDAMLENGVRSNGSRPKNSGLIVSLTSFPARIVNVKYTIYSLLQQSVLPEKIILWLSEKEFPDTFATVPETLRSFERFGLEIRFVKENFRSYNKLVFALIEYPEHMIVTADDDLFYKEDWLEKLVDTHVAYPEDIIAHRVHNISFTGGKIDPYNSWNGDDKETSYLNFLTGCGGVLYPPHALHPDVTRSDHFLKLCPYADDIWFYVMAIRNQRKIRLARDHYHTLISFDTSLDKTGEAIPQLQKINVYNNQNDIQLKAVLEYYGMYTDFYESYAAKKDR